MGLAHFTIVFLDVHIIGYDIYPPANAFIVKKEFISSFVWGTNLNLISHVVPDAIFPFGVYSTSKKFYD